MRRIGISKVVLRKAPSQPDASMSLEDESQQPPIAGFSRDAQNVPQPSSTDIARQLAEQYNAALAPPSSAPPPQSMPQSVPTNALAESDESDGLHWGPQIQIQEPQVLSQIDEEVVDRDVSPAKPSWVTAPSSLPSLSQESHRSRHSEGNQQDSTDLSEGHEEAEDLESVSTPANSNPDDNAQPAPTPTPKAVNGASQGQASTSVLQPISLPRHQLPNSTPQKGDDSSTRREMLSPLRLASNISPHKTVSPSLASPSTRPTAASPTQPGRVAQRGQLRAPPVTAKPLRPGSPESSDDFTRGMALRENPRSVLDRMMSVRKEDSHASSSSASTSQSSIPQAEAHIDPTPPSMQGQAIEPTLLNTPIEPNPTAQTNTSPFRPYYSSETQVDPPAGGPAVLGSQTQIDAESPLFDRPSPPARRLGRLQSSSQAVRSSSGLFSDDDDIGALPESQILRFEDSFNATQIAVAREASSPFKPAGQSTERSTRSGSRVPAIPAHRMLQRRSEGQRSGPIAPAPPKAPSPPSAEYEATYVDPDAGTSSEEAKPEITQEEEVVSGPVFPPPLPKATGSPLQRDVAPTAPPATTAPAVSLEHPPSTGDAMDLDAPPAGPETDVKMDENSTLLTDEALEQVNDHAKEDERDSLDEPFYRPPPRPTLRSAPPPPAAEPATTPPPEMAPPPVQEAVAPPQDRSPKKYGKRGKKPQVMESLDSDSSSAPGDPDDHTFREPEPTPDSNASPKQSTTAAANSTPTATRKGEERAKSAASKRMASSKAGASKKSSTAASTSSSRPVRNKRKQLSPSPELSDSSSSAPEDEEDFSFRPTKKGLEKAKEKAKLAVKEKSVEPARKKSRASSGPGTARPARASSSRAPSTRSASRARSVLTEPSASPQKRSASPLKTASLAPQPSSSAHAPIRVLAYWPKTDGYYPGTVVGRSKTGLLKVAFDDGSSRTMGIDKMRLLQLRAGEAVLSGSSDSLHVASDYTGQGDVVATGKNGKKVNVPTAKLVVLPSEIANFGDRMLPQSTIDSHWPLAAARSSLLSSSAVFEGKVFILTGTDDALPTETLKKRIEQHGGRIVSQWETIFELSGSRRLSISEAPFVLQLGPRCVLTSKVMIALAAGTPILSAAYVEAAIDGADWRSYLISPGESKILRQPASQLVDHLWGEPSWVPAQATAIRRPLVGKKVLYIEPSARFSRRDELKVLVPFCLQAIGATVTRSPVVPSAFSEFDLVMVDDRDKGVPLSKTAISSGKLVNVGWLKACLIVGAALPAELVE